MSGDCSRGAQHQDANQQLVHPIQQGGEVFYRYPEGGDFRRAVESRAPGHYPPGHEASLRHQEHVQQSWNLQQQQAMMPQHQFTAPQSMQHQPQYMAPEMYQQQQQYIAPQMHNQPMYTAPPTLLQQQQYTGSFMPPPNVVSGQGQWPLSASPQVMQQQAMMPQWVGPVAQQAQSQYHRGYPSNFVTQPPPQGFVTNSQVNDTPGCNDVSQQQHVQRRQHQEKSYEQPGKDEQTESTTPDEPPKEEAVDLQARTPKKYKLKLLPGDKLIFEDSVTLICEHGSFQSRARPDYPVFLVNSADIPSDKNFFTAYLELKGDLVDIFQKVDSDTTSGSDTVSSQQMVVEETESNAKPPVQPDNQKPTEQESVKAEKAQHPKKPEEPEEPEEPAQQPKETTPIAEKLVSQPKQQKPVTETLATQPDVEVNQPAEQVQKIRHVAEQDDGLSGRTYAAMVNKPKVLQPTIVNLAQKTTQPVPKQKQAKERIPQVQKPKEQPDVESNQPTSRVFNTGHVKKVKEFGQRHAELANQPKQSAAIRPIQTSTQQLPKQKKAQERVPPVATQSGRPFYSVPKVEPSSLINPQTDSPWTVVGVSSSGPSSSHTQAEPVIVFKAPPSKPKETEKVKEEESIQEEAHDPPAEKSEESRSSVGRTKKTKKAGKPTQSKAEREAQERVDSEAIDRAFAIAEEERALQKPLDKYIESRKSLRATLAKDGFLADTVDTDGFEQSLLEYFVQNKKTEWISKKEEVKEFLKKNMDSRENGTDPRDEQLVKKYSFLHNKLCPVIIQDILAIRISYPSRSTETLEKEYFDLVFDPDRPALVTNFVTREMQPAPHDPSLKPYDGTLTKYVTRQNEIRAAGHSDGVDYKTFTERFMNDLYFKNKIRLDDLLANKRESLVESYYRYWNWQYRRTRESMVQDKNYLVKLNCVYSLASRDVSDPLNDILLCDAHSLAKVQKGLYESLPFDQLTEYSGPYQTLVYWSKRAGKL